MCLNRNLQRRMLPIMLFLALAIGCQTAAAAETDWQWLRVEPHLAPPIPSFQVFQGLTKLELGNHAFKGKLAGKEGNVPYEFDIEGTITGDKVTAVEVQPGTDAGKRTYKGFFEKFQGPGGEYDRIFLSDDKKFRTTIQLMKFGGSN